MQLAKTFAGKRFVSLFTVAGLGLLLEYIRFVADALIGGQLLGQEAVAGVTLVAPLFTFILFFSFLIAVGSNVLISTTLGDLKDKHKSRETASCFFSQAILLILVLGTITTGLFISGKSLFLNLFDSSPQILQFASEYYTYIALLPIPLMFASFLYEFVMNQGNEKICLIASLFQIFVSILLSFILCLCIGCAGLSLGTLIATIIGDLIYLSHFKTKRHILKWRPYFNIKSIIQVVKLGINDGIEGLYGGILLFVLNLFVLHFFGDECLIVLAVVFNFWAFIYSCNDAFDEVMMPMVCTYYGEGNQQGMKFFMNLITKSVFLEQLLVTLFVFIFSDTIPSFFNLSSELVPMTSLALKIVSISCLCFTLCSVWVTYYVYLSKIKFAFVLLTLTQLIFPIICPIAGGILIGQKGIWYGFIASGILGIISIFYGCRIKFSQLSFPYLLKKEILENQFLYNTNLKEKNVNLLLISLQEKLSKFNISKEKQEKFAFTLENIFKTLSQKNKNLSHTAIECTVSVHSDKMIEVILRDSGALIAPHFDFPQIDYMVSMGYNRFIIKI